MNPQSLMNVIKEKNQELTRKNEDLERLSEEHAKYKQEYLVALAQEITRLKIDGQSVTLIKDLAKGNKGVAELGYKVDVSYGVRDACKERINDLRVGIDSSRSILSWLKAEMEITK